MGQARPNKKLSQKGKNFQELKICGHGTILALTKTHTFWKSAFRSQRRMHHEKEIEAFVNAANEQELEAAWNNLSAEEQRVFEQLMEEEPPEDALAFFAQLYDDAPKEQTSETVNLYEN